MSLYLLQFFIHKSEGIFVLCVMLRSAKCSYYTEENTILSGEFVVVAASMLPSSGGHGRGCMRDAYVVDTRRRCAGTRES